MSSISPLTFLSDGSIMFNSWSAVCFECAFVLIPFLFSLKQSRWMSTVNRGFTLLFSSSTRTPSDRKMQLNHESEARTPDWMLNSYIQERAQEPETMKQLLFRSESSSPLKEFNREVRAPLDVKHLIDAAVITTHTEETCLNSILTEQLRQMALNNAGESFDEVQFEHEMFSVMEHGQPQRLRRVVQQYSDSELFDVDQTWIATFCELDGLRHRHVGISFLSHPTNFGHDMEEISTIILVVGPTSEEKLLVSAVRLSSKDSKSSFTETDEAGSVQEKESFAPGRGIYNDFVRRWKHYGSDFTDGFKDVQSFSKVISTSVFLVFTILPTSIAYGMLNDENTGGLINVQKVILGQWIGGIIFGIFGGQELLIISTTAPLSIYISVIQKISEVNGYSFYSMYAAVGIWAQIFLILYAIFQAAQLMKYTKRSTEEIFGLFIAFALTYKAVEAIVSTYTESYSECYSLNGTQTLQISGGCAPSAALLFVFLVFGTLWTSLTLSSLRSSPFLQRTMRDTLSDYALPIGVIVMALISYFLFYNVDKATFNYYPYNSDIDIGSVFGLSWQSHLIAFGLGFPLSLLFFMDQVLVTNTIDNKQHSLKKGSAYNWDLLVVGLLNILLSVLGLPWMHGALPSAYLHLKALADVEDRVHNGYVQPVIVLVRETRLAVLISHILMVPIYFFLIPFIAAFVPTALFHGLFLFMAISSLTGNELWERTLLIFTEQRSYPPSHYIRSVPQRVVHIFTIFELFQLALLIVIGFYPWHYVEMVFPVVIALFIPLRHFLLPMVFNKDHLEAVDSEH